MLKFSKHSRTRIAERRLELSWIEAAIARPDWIRSDPDDDPQLTHLFKTVPAFGHRILKVVHRQDGGNVLAITAHFDRSAKR